MNFTRIRRLLQYLLFLYVLTLTDLWSTLSRILRRGEPQIILDERPADKLRSPLEFVKPVLAAVVKSPAKMKKMFAPQGVPLFADDPEDARSDMVNEDSCDIGHLYSEAVGPTTSDWAAGPRDETSLPRILTAMRSKNKNEGDYALNEMVKIIEKIDMDSHSRLVCDAFETFLNVSTKKDLPSNKCSNILNHLPFLYSCSTSSDEFTPYGKRMLEFLIHCLQGVDQPRRSAIYATTALLERDSIAEEELQERIVPTLFELLLSQEVVEEHRNELATTLCRIVQGRRNPRWTFEHFIPKYSLLLRDEHVHVKKAAISILGHLSHEFGEKFTKDFVVPHVLALIGDGNWSVRKIVSEIIVEVSHNCPRETRKNLLAPRFNHLLKDTSRWVAYEAFQQLGPFISTFADSSITGLNINEAGQIVSDEDVTMEEKSHFQYEELPEGVYIPSEGHNRSRPFSQDEADTVLGEMTNMLDNWDHNDFRTGPSISGSTSAAAKCSSVEDLSCLDYDDLDQSFFDEDEGECMEGTEAETKGDFGPGYWSAGHNIVDISDDLIAFGVGDDSSSLQGLAIALENAKVTTSPSSTDSVSTFSEKLSDSSFKSAAEDMEDDDPIRDCRGSDEEDEKMEVSYTDADELGSNVHLMQHVPRVLIDNFLSMVSPTVQSDPDINRYCAHNFPAVAYTLGRDSWPILREAYKRLANEDIRVRTTIASSLHEMARIVGREWTATDLLPIFNQYRDDAPEVRYNILKNLFAFFQCLSDEKKLSMIDVLPEMMSLSTNNLRYDWRHRHEFASQCRKLCSLYGNEEINRAISPIGLMLANDKIAEVRTEAVLLLVEIFRRLVNEETAQQSVEKTEEAKSFISGLIRDLVSSFANSTKWCRRQTFTQLCYGVLADNALSQAQFRHYLLAQLCAKATDKVANIRMKACKALVLLDHTLSPEPQGEETTQTVKEVLKRLAKDGDIDVSREARMALKENIDDKIDLELRGRTIQEKENMFFGDVNVTNHEPKDMTIDSTETPAFDRDNYDVVDMDVSLPSCDNDEDEGDKEEPNTSEC